MSFDYLIVGNAILGLTTAYRLTQLAPHAKIGIIGPSHRRGSATTAAGAMLGLFGEITTAYYTDHYHKAYFALARYAQAEWPQLVAELNQQLPTKEHIAIHPNGTFVLLNAPNPEQDDTLNYQAIVQALIEYNAPYEKVAPKDVPGLAPADSAQTIASLYIPDERSINPVAVLYALEKILYHQPNVTPIDASATRLQVTQSAHPAITGVELHNGDQQTADQVIIAAGTSSQDLIDTLPALRGRIPRILSGEGVSFIFDQSALGSHQIEHVIRTPNRAGACSLHMVPNAKEQHLLYLGASNVLQRRALPGASMQNITWLLQSSLQDMST